MDTIFDQLVALFFSEDSIKTTILILCNAKNSHSDVISDVITTMIKSSLQIQFTLIGLQPFHSRDLVIPYKFMNKPQREFVIESLKQQNCWMIFDQCVALKKRKSDVSLDLLLILTSFCQLILDSSFEDSNIRLVVCNIILQRIRASVPIAQSIQKKLNSILFKQSYIGGGANSQNEIVSAESEPGAKQISALLGHV
jgi:hypothetical protein